MMSRCAHLGGWCRLSVHRARQAGEVRTRYTAHHSMHPTIAGNVTTRERQLSLAFCQGALGSCALHLLHPVTLLTDYRPVRRTEEFPILSNSIRAYYIIKKKNLDLPHGWIRHLGFPLFPEREDSINHEINQKNTHWHLIPNLNSINIFLSIETGW